MAGKRIQLENNYETFLKIAELVWPKEIISCVQILPLCIYPDNN